MRQSMLEKVLDWLWRDDEIRQDNIRENKTWVSRWVAVQPSETSAA